MSADTKIIRHETPRNANLASFTLPVGDQLILRLYDNQNQKRPFLPININVVLPSLQGNQLAFIEFSRVEDTDEVEMQVRLRSWPKRRGLLIQDSNGYIFAKYGPVIRIEREDGTIQELDAPGRNLVNSHRIEFVEWMDEQKNDSPLKFLLGSKDNPSSLYRALLDGRVTLAF